LPNGLFSYQKYQFGEILFGFGMENVGIFYAHLVNFTAIWYILWPFSKFVIIWYILWPFGNFVVIWNIFWYIVTLKIWQPCRPRA
jgi:hypothetical protein